MKCRRTQHLRPNFYHILSDFCRPTEKQTLPAAQYDAQEFQKLLKKMAPVSTCWCVDKTLECHVLHFITDT